jgi:hypothetical protein
MRLATMTRTMLLMLPLRPSKARAEMTNMKMKRSFALQQSVAAWLRLANLRQR